MFARDVLPGGTMKGPNGGARDWLLIAVPGVIWGASFLFIAEGLRAMAPNGVTFTRILIGFLTLAALPSARAPLPRSAWPAIIALGIVWMAFPLSMFPFAEQRVSSALTGMLNGANPLFVAVVAALIARRLPSKRMAMGLGVGMAGAVLVALPAMGEGRSSMAGVLMILAALVSYGFALNLARPLQQQHGALPVVWRAQFVALLITLPLGLPDLLNVRPEPWALVCIALLGVFGTAVAQVVASIAAGRLGATRASASTFLIPPVALGLGMLIRDERVALLSVLGGAVCLAGAWLMRRAGEPEGPSASSPGREPAA